MNDDHDASGANAPADDALAGLAPADEQRLAARMAQDAFGRLFRLTVEGDEAALGEASAEIARRARNWVRAAKGEEARALRLALLLCGIDQWGLAWSQAFGLSAIPAVSALLGELRGGLDAAAEARFQQKFAAIEATEADAIDFKMELRRNIHMALWHAMAACETREEARRIAGALGSLLLALTQRMPMLGWRLAADALAHIQLRCLDDPAAVGELARDMTEELFGALRHGLPAGRFEAVLAHANEAVVAWQRAQRAARA